MRSVSMTLPLRMRLAAVVVVASLMVDSGVGWAMGRLRAFGLVVIPSKVLGPALELAKPAETARNKPMQKALVSKGFCSFRVFHRRSK